MNTIEIKLKYNRLTELKSKIQSNIQLAKLNLDIAEKLDEEAEKIKKELTLLGYRVE